MSFHRSRHCALFELLTQRPNHTIAATTPHPLNASALAQSAVMPVSHGTFQPCAGMSVASVSLSIGRSQPNNYSACRFHTAHRQAPCSGLTLPWCRNAVAYIWCGIAVLPCFSASGKVPVTRCGLPLRGTYAACGAYAPRKPLAGENDPTFSSGAVWEVRPPAPDRVVQRAHGI